MSEIVIDTIKDLFVNYKKIINSRYVGDFEFKEFNSFLSWKRCFGFLVNTILIILSILLIFETFILIISNGWGLFFIVISVSINLIISYGLIIFSLVNIFELLKTKKYLVKKDFKKIKNFEWGEWQFIDIIFPNPIRLENGKTIKIEINKFPAYSLNFLCQYPTGHFAWFGVGKSHNEKYKINNIKMWDKSFNEGKFRKNGILEIKEKFIMDNMKMDIYEDIFSGEKITLNSTSKTFNITSKNISPATIVGIRVRANIQNESITIRKFDVEN